VLGGVAALSLALAGLAAMTPSEATSLATNSACWGRGTFQAPEKAPAAKSASGYIWGYVTVDGVANPDFAAIGIWVDGEESKCVAVDLLSGYYIVPDLEEGPHDLLAWGPGVYTRVEKPGIAVPPTAGIQVDFALKAMDPVPPGLSLKTGDNDVTLPASGNGAGFVYWAEPLTIQLTGQCVGATSATWELEFWGKNPMTGKLTESPPGHYTDTVPSPYPRHGFAQLTLTIICPEGPPVLVAVDLFFDPSGVIVDQYGNPVEGAIATLEYRSGSSWSVAPSSLLHADTSVNPIITGPEGRFNWDVTPGDDYRVAVTAPQAINSVVTEAMTVLPQRSALVIQIPVKAPVAPVPSVTAWPATIDPGRVLDVGVLGWPATSSVSSDSTITWPSSSIVVDAVRWVVEGVSAGSGASFTVPATAAGETVTAIITAHREIVGHRDGIAPVDGGTFETFTFVSFTFVAPAVKVSGNRVTPPPPTQSPAPTPEPSVPELPPHTDAYQAFKYTVPLILGVPKVGKTLKAKATGWEKGAKLSYQWHANGKKIKGATKAKFTITKKYKGKRISVKVTGTKAGITPVTAPSKKTAKVKQ